MRPSLKPARLLLKSKSLSSSMGRPLTPFHLEWLGMGPLHFKKTIFKQKNAGASRLILALRSISVGKSITCFSTLGLKLFLESHSRPKFKRGVLCLELLLLELSGETKAKAN